MLYSEVLTQIQNNLGRSDDNTNAIIMAHWNNCQKIIARHLEYEDLQAVAEPTLSSGAYEFALSAFSFSNFRQIYSMSVLDGTSYRKLDYVTPLVWETRLAPTTSR